MKLSGRNLELNTQGEDVRLLHWELMLLHQSNPAEHISIPENELGKKAYGPSTKKAVSQLQWKLTGNEFGDGIVTEELAGHINAAVGQLPPFHVWVEVEDEATGDRLGGLTARVVHLGDSEEDTLASAMTDTEGTVELTYDVKALTSGKRRPAILVRILAPDGRVLATWPTREYPGPEESFHFAIRQDTADDLWRAMVEVRSSRTQEPVAGITVDLRDWDRAGDDALGQEITSTDGIARFEYRGAAFRKSPEERAGPDLIARVYDRTGRLLGKSKRRTSAGRDEHILIEVIEPEAPRIAGRAVLSPEWGSTVTIEAFSDAELKQFVGKTKTGKHGRFEIILEKDPPKWVWFRWSQRKERGRSPTLQPFSTASTIRLHVYRRWVGEATGNESYQATVRTSAGRPAVGNPVALLESTLTRCQVLGEALTLGSGSGVITYDASTLFMDRPDLRILVFDRQGVPLLESTTPSATIPGAFAQTK